MTTYETALKTALRCSDADRERLAYELLRSLPFDSSPQVLTADLVTEFDRRLDKFERGEATGTPWEELRERLGQRFVVEQESRP